MIRLTAANLFVILFLPINILIDLKAIIKVNHILNYYKPFSF